MWVKAKWDPTKSPGNDPKNVHLDPIFEVRYFPDEYTDVLITAPASEWNDSEFEDAISSLKISPHFTVAPTAVDWYNKGLALYNQGKYDEAIKALDNATKFDPQYVDAWETKGWALYFQERYDEAAEAFDEIIKIDPQDKVAWNSKGLALSELEKYNEAIEAYDKAIELDPNFAPPWNNKCEALDKLGKYDEAIKSSYTGTKLLNLTDRHHLFVLAQAHYERGNYKAAIRYYDEVITLDIQNAIDPSNATVWYNKGMALKTLNRTTEADTAFAKAKELGYTN